MLIIGRRRQVIELDTVGRAIRKHRRTPRTARSTVWAVQTLLTQTLLAKRQVRHFAIRGCAFRRALSFHDSVVTRWWELRLTGRDRIARALYVTAIGRRVVVVRAFVKKTQKTP